MRRIPLFSAVAQLALVALSLSSGCYASSHNIDPTCTANSCPVGTVEVERCVGDTPCFEEALCGPAIFCADDICEPSEPCYADETEVPFCDESSPNCRARISCGAPLYCQSIQCEAAPACGSDERVVGACDASACRSVSVCGSTIYCIPTDMCLAEPSCETYEEQVPLDFECGPESFCRFVEECSVTIQCLSAAIMAG